MQAWELFFLVASVMPPSKEFVSLVSEYVHTVAHPDGPSACEEVQQPGRQDLERTQALRQGWAQAHGAPRLLYGSILRAKCTVVTERLLLLTSPFTPPT